MSPSADILAVSNRLKMCRVAADPFAAEVVEFQFARDGPAQQFIDEDVNAAMSRPPVNRAVAAVGCSLPVPATITPEGYAGPKLIDGPVGVGSYDHESCST